MSIQVLRLAGKALKLLLVCSVLLYMLIMLTITPFSDMKSQSYDLPSAMLISVGFAASFRAMLCCRKKV